MAISIKHTKSLAPKVASRTRRQLRARKKINGTPERPRLVVTRSSRHLFVQVIDDHTIKVHTWERGAGATLACGTGSCACAVGSFLNGFTGRSVDVQLYLGTLHIEYNEQDGNVYMTGPAAVTFTGEWLEA